MNIKKPASLLLDAQHRHRAKMTTQPARGEPAPRNACYNRAPYAGRVMVQFGWSTPINEGWGNYTSTPIFIKIDNPMTKECNYTQHKKTNGDPRCTDCIWKSKSPTLD